MNYYLYFLTILLSLYTDSPLQRYMGYMGFCIVPTLSFLMYPIIVHNKRYLITDELTTKFSKLINYTAILSVIALFVTALMGYSWTQLGESLPTKMIKLIIIHYSYVTTIMLMLVLGRNLSLQRLLAPFYYCLIIITAIAATEYFVGESIFNPIHFGEDASLRLWDYNRVRLLTAESSHTTVQIEILFAVSLYYNFIVRNSSFHKLVTLGCGLLLIGTSGSKTLMVALFLCLIYANKSILFNRLSFKSILMLAGVAVAFGVAYIYILPNLEASFTNDIEDSTSTITRTYSVLVGYITGLLSPIGTGFQSYLIILPNMMKSMMWLTDIILPGSNLGEIEALLASGSDEALAAKSFFGQASFYWGVIGNVYLLKLLWRTFRDAFPDNEVPGNVIFETLTFVLLFELAFSTGLDYITVIYFTLFVLLKWQYNFGINI